MKCPICGNDVDREQEDFPFCCERCRLLDLYAWLNGDYYIPGEKYYKEEE
jgi:endogenous inhibitor of DNA gyrase (YacG/DUF329 family)